MITRESPLTPFERGPRDSEHVATWVSEVSANLGEARFGSRWAGPSGGPTRGEVKTCSWDGSFEEDPWAFRSHGPLTGGRREYFYYLLADSAIPTLERIRWTLPTPSSRAAGEWAAIARVISDSLTIRTRQAAGRVRAAGSRTTGTTVRVTVQALGDSVVAEMLTPALLQDFSDSSSWLAFSEFAEDEIAVEVSTAELGQSLRGHWPAVAAALLRGRAAIADTSAMIDALARSERGSFPQEEKDRVRWSIHAWCHLVLSLGDDLKPCTACAPLESAFNQIGLRAFAGHYGGWYTNGALIAPLLQRAGSNRWADLVFLRSLRGDFDLFARDSCLGSFYDCQPFQTIIRVGERFLKEHPRSSITGELRLLVARAHETGWSLSKSPASPTEEGAFDPTNFTIEAPANRLRALELYEEHLHANPTDPRNPIIKRRLARIRLDIDTGCRAFVNWGVC